MPAGMTVQDHPSTPLKRDPGNPAPPPADGSSLSSPFHVQLIPPASAVVVAKSLPVLLGKLQPPQASSAEVLVGLRRAAGSPRSRGPQLEKMVAMLSGIHGNNQRDDLAAWMRGGEWDPQETLPGTQLLSWVGERLGHAREPLAEVLTARFEAAGLEALEAANKGWQAAGVLQAVHMTWDRLGSVPDEAESTDSLVNALSRERETSKKILVEAQRVLQQYLPSISPTGPLRI